MRVGDLVKLKKQINFAPDDQNILGFIIDIRKMGDSSSSSQRIKREYLGTEYKVSIITNNKTAWYIEDSLELVSEGWRFGKEQGNGRVSYR